MHSHARSRSIAGAGSYATLVFPHGDSDKASLLGGDVPPAQGSSREMHLGRVGGSGIGASGVLGLALVGITWEKSDFSGKPSVISVSLEKGIRSVTPGCTDPYLEPGYIRRRDGSNDISWHPYTSASLLNTGKISHPPLSYSKLLASSFRATDPRLDFARNRTILLIGESLDRDNAHSFCTQNSPSDFIGEEGHISFACQLADLALTMAMWFTTGMRPSDTPWFFPSDPKPWTFEERFAERFKPLLPSIGSPELVVLSSHFWDLKFFQDRELRRRLLAEEPDAPFHITEEDLAWHRSRLVEFVALVRSTFPDALVMWRLGTKWKVDEEAGFGDGNLGVFRLNESTRAMMRMLEVPLFNWAALIEGERGYKDGQHFLDGAAGSLHTTMVMHYLEKAVTRQPLC